MRDTRPSFRTHAPINNAAPGAQRGPRWRVATLLGALTLAALLVGCASTSGTGATTSGHSTGGAATATPTTSAPAATATTSSSSGSGPYAVKVYFSRHPDSDNDPNKVFSVMRSSPTLMVATYAIQQLIAGPSASEVSAGYYTELTGSLSGASNCGGADFVITLNHRGPTPQTGTATLKFCRTTSLAGDLTGGRISAEISAILTQFPSTQHVVILTAAGSCFDDLRGGNLCLQ
jgi:hypothetical protein